MTGGDHIDSTADEVGAEVVPANTPPGGNLFRTDDPVEVLEKATRVANALKPVLTAQKMTQRIGGGDHVKIEGWTTLGAMLGVMPVVRWSRPVPDTSRAFEREEGYGDKARTIRGHGSDWEAHVDVVTLDGRTIGGAEAMCCRDEPSWTNSDDYAVRSMAQTRATSKALANPLRFIVTLAGYEGTPAEEMTVDMRQGAAGGFQGGKPSEKQVGYLKSLVRRHKPNMDELRILLDQANAKDVPAEAGWLERLDRVQMSALIKIFTEGRVPDPAHPSDIPDDPDEFAPQDPLPADVSDSKDAPF